MFATLQVWNILFILIAQKTRPIPRVLLFSETIQWINAAVNKRDLNISDLINFVWQNIQSYKIWTWMTSDLPRKIFDLFYILLFSYESSHCDPTLTIISILQLYKALLIKKHTLKSTSKKNNSTEKVFPRITFTR